jgi:hypothetical protein
MAVVEAVPFDVIIVVVGRPQLALDSMALDFLGLIALVEVGHLVPDTVPPVTLGVILGSGHGVAESLGAGMQAVTGYIVVGDLGLDRVVSHRHAPWGSLVALYVEESRFPALTMLTLPASTAARYELVHIGEQFREAEEWA